MIDGIGIDVVDIDRFKASLERTPGLAQKLFTEAEQTKPVASLAARFAAKEAFSKALGTGLRGDVNLHAITVAHDDMGKPCFQFNANVSLILSQHKINQQHLSISDEKNIAVAFVVLEKL